MNVILLHNNQRHVSSSHVYKSLTQCTIPGKIHLLVHIILMFQFLRNHLQEVYKIRESDIRKT